MKFNTNYIDFMKRMLAKKEIVRRIDAISFFELKKLDLMPTVTGFFNQRISDSTTNARTS